MIEVFEVQGEAWYIAAYLDKIDKANRKAKRAGLPAGFSAVITGTTMVTRERGGLKEGPLQGPSGSGDHRHWRLPARRKWGTAGAISTTH